MPSTLENAEILPTPFMHLIFVYMDMFVDGLMSIYSFVLEYEFILSVNWQFQIMAPVCFEFLSCYCVNI